MENESSFDYAQNGGVEGWRSGIGHGVNIFHPFLHISIDLVFYRLRCMNTHIIAHLRILWMQLVEFAAYACCYPRVSI